MPRTENTTTPRATRVDGFTQAGVDMIKKKMARQYHKGKALPEIYRQIAKKLSMHECSVRRRIPKESLIEEAMSLGIKGETKPHNA